MGIINTFSTEEPLGPNVVVTKLEAAINWSRKFSFFLYPFATACCAMEFMAVGGPRYDLDRFGAALRQLQVRLGRPARIGVALDGEDVLLQLLGIERADPRQCF